MADNRSRASHALAGTSPLRKGVAAYILGRSSRSLLDAGGSLVSGGSTRHPNDGNKRQSMQLLGRTQIAGANYDKPIIVAAYSAIPIGAILATVLFLLSDEWVPDDACEKWKASGVVLEKPFEKQGDHAFIALMPNLAHMADDSNNPRRSRSLLCENGEPIGTPHSIHEDIRSGGAGRFSHWERWLIFSTSDNSDPNTNDRQYTLVRPPR
jgi:hypothetical protein